MDWDNIQYLNLFGDSTIATDNNTSEYLKTGQNMGTIIVDILKVTNYKNYAYGGSMIMNHSSDEPVPSLVEQINTFLDSHNQHNNINNDKSHTGVLISCGTNDIKEFINNILSDPGSLCNEYLKLKDFFSKILLENIKNIHTVTGINKFLISQIPLITLTPRFINLGIDTDKERFINLTISVLNNILEEIKTILNEDKINVEIIYLSDILLRISLDPFKYGQFTEIKIPYSDSDNPDREEDNFLFYDSLHPTNSAWLKLKPDLEIYLSNSYHCLFSNQLITRWNEKGVLRFQDIGAQIDAIITEEQSNHIFQKLNIIQPDGFPYSCNAIQYLIPELVYIE